MIRLGGLFQGHLNLNGDWGNLLVLQKQILWRGVDCELVDIQSQAQLMSGLDFILIGHGSDAAWADIEPNFIELAPFISDLMNSGTPLLAVSTGFEMAVKHRIIADLDLTLRPERVSKFVVVEDHQTELLGYVNTDSDLPTIHRFASAVGTTLHGPVLSKNPTLVDEFLAAIFSKAKLTVPPFADAKKAGQLADLIAEVWKLEGDLANE